MKITVVSYITVEATSIEDACEQVGRVIDAGIGNADAHVIDYTNDAEDAHASDACPGCGAEPGDGVTATCNHPEGCGFWKAQEE